MLRTPAARQDLSLSRCSITDQGGAAVMQALSCSCVESLDLSWNSLRGSSTRALHDALQTNGALQLLNLSYNGLSDADTARALAGLLRHGGYDVFWATNRLARARCPDARHPAQCRCHSPVRRVCCCAPCQQHPVAHVPRCDCVQAPGAMWTCPTTMSPQALRWW